MEGKQLFNTVSKSDRFTKELNSLDPAVQQSIDLDFVALHRDKDLDRSNSIVLHKDHYNGDPVTYVLFSISDNELALSLLQNKNLFLSQILNKKDDRVKKVLTNFSLIK